jgi:putative ABC transport system permease protein
MRILTSPWWRAPFQLLRRPGVALSLIAATFVAALPAAAAPLFLGTAQSATVNDQVAGSCPNVSGVTVQNYLFETEPAQVLKTADTVTAEITTVPNIAPANTTVYQSRIPVVGLPKGDPDSRPWLITLMSRNGFQDHIKILEKADVTDPMSVWVPDDIAASWHVGPGDKIAIGSDNKTEVTVAAIYKNMNVGHVDRFWCSVRPVFQGNILAENGQPSLLLGSLQTVLAVLNSETSFSQAPTVTFESPLRNPAPSPELARATTRTLTRKTPELLDAFEIPTQYGGSQRATITTRLPLFMSRAGLVERTLRVPIYAVSGAGVMVGLLVLGAATVLWARRREHELAVLAIRGSAPLSLGFKAVLESIPAILIGAAVAAVAARWLVLQVGPAGTLSGDAQRVGLWSTTAVAAAAVVTVLIVATRRARRLTDTTPHLHRRNRLAAVPWELLIFAAAWVLWKQMGGDLISSDGGLAVGGTVISLPPRTLVIPIMVIVASSLLAARIVAGWLRWRGLKRAPKGQARYLARRRLGREPVVAALLLAIAAIPAAVAGFAATAAGSVQTTIEAKALAATGSDIVVRTGSEVPVPTDIARIGPATEVLRTDGIYIGKFQSSLLGVDPEEFKKVVTVGTQVAGPDFASVLDRMAAEGPSSPAITVLASAPVAPGPADLVSAYKTVHVNVVQVRNLPGVVNNLPVVIAARAAVGDEIFGGAASAQIWVHTHHTAAVQAAALGNRDLDVKGITIASDLFADTLFEPITYIFQYFVAIALLTGVVVAVGLLLYLESRTVAHRRAYIMLRRMGLRPRTHRVALLLELSTALGLGLLVAAGTVAVIAFFLRTSFDVNPDKAPGAILSVSIPALSVIVGIVFVTAIGAALFGHARVARAKPAEVLRDAV